MKKLVWRLGKLPSPDEVRELVKDKIITQEEAREILFNTEIEEVSGDNLKEEIKFLRKVIESLSSRNQIIETVKQVWTPYHNQQWFQPYMFYCNSGELVTVTTAGSANLLTGSITSNNIPAMSSSIGDSGGGSFEDISTF